MLDPNDPTKEYINYIYPFNNLKKKKNNFDHIN